MNRLSLPRQAQIIGGLVEGNSIRSVERMTDTHRDTIMRLMVRVGQGCAQIMDDEMRDLTCRRLQLDEIWGYVHKKQRRIITLYTSSGASAPPKTTRLPSKTLSGTEKAPRWAAIQPYLIAQRRLWGWSEDGNSEPSNASAAL